MPSWRVAKSLETLISQANRQWPSRSRASDGTIGDTRHQAEHSDHNPNSAGVVCAWDCTQDPAHGADMARLSENLRLSKDPRIGYVIYNHRIFDGSTYNGAWTWKPYSGSSPHTDHMHISVVQNARLYDDAASWPVFGSSPSKPPTHSRPVCSQGHGKGSQAVRDVQTQLNRHGAHLTVDADFGRLTDSAVRAFQKAHGLAQDGIVGVHTWAALDAK